MSKERVSLLIEPRTSRTGLAKVERRIAEGTVGELTIRGIKITDAMWRVIKAANDKEIVVTPSASAENAYNERLASDEITAGCEVDPG